MGLADVTIEAVESAIVEFDTLGREAFLGKYHFGPARRFFLTANHKRYDSKAILGAAHGFARPDLGPLGPDRLTGGERGAARKLRALGFKVEATEQPGDSSATAPARRSPPDRISDGIGITDLNWFRQLRDLRPTPDRVNFWTPTPWNLTHLETGSKWYFMLKAPIRKLGGFGTVESVERMSISKAWERFGLGNGVASLDELRERTHKYAKRRSQQVPDDGHLIGCIVLRAPEFWTEEAYSDPEFVLNTAVPDQVVTFKYVDKKHVQVPIEHVTKPLSVGNLDATFAVAQAADRVFIYLESRGPGRNRHYLEALETLLATLASLDASLIDVLVASRAVVRRPEAERRISPSQPFPIRLSCVDSFAELRRDLTRSVADTAREAASAGSGNPTRRLRLEVQVPGRPSIHDLAASLTIDTTTALRSTSHFDFRASPPRQSTKPTTRKALAATSVDRIHAQMQESLYSLLVDEYGTESVSVELLTASGRPADVVVKEENGFAIYEIKTAPTAKDCVRQALGQLLEYAYWPGSPRITALWVVGQAEEDDTSEAFLNGLRVQFGLPIRYRRHS